MNCTNHQRKILLAETGELSGREAAALEAHLANCAECRAFRSSSKQVRSLTRRSLRAVQPRPDTVRCILDAGRLRAARPAIDFPHAAVRVLATAAALAIVAAGWMIFLPDRQDTRIGEMNAILAVVTEEDFPQFADGSAAEADDELRTLADKLLVLQGFSNSEYAEEELLIPGAEPQPTALRSRSIPAGASRKCV